MFQVFFHDLTRFNTSFAVIDGLFLVVTNNSEILKVFQTLTNFCLLFSFTNIWAMQVNYNAAIINLGIVCVRVCVRVYERVRGCTSGCACECVWANLREWETEREGYNFSSALRILALPKDNILHKHWFCKLENMATILSCLKVKFAREDFKLPVTNLTLSLAKLWVKKCLFTMIRSRKKYLSSHSGASFSYFKCINKIQIGVKRQFV